MQPWRKKKGLMRSTPKYTTVFGPMEREVIGDLTATVSEALIARAQSAPKDELAEMLDMPTGHTEAPEDPSLARLFPDGKTVHVVGLPQHWGFIGETKKGWHPNTLTPVVGDANTETPEFKAFLVNIEPAVGEAVS